MPNEAKKNQGISLKDRFKYAADETAKQRASSTAESSEKSDKKKVTKRRATKELVASQGSSQKEKEPKQRKKFVFAGKTRIAIIVLVILILLAALIYPAARNYYQSIRQQQQLQACLDAIEERNSTIESQNSALETDEGVEAQAREELGWVAEGENSAIVTNIEEGEDSSGKLPTQIDTSEIEPPHTWYYDILDIVFFVDLNT